VIAQELLEALNKAQNETNLDQVAVWALSKYLQGAWKDAPAKNIRPYDLGQVLSDFFVDLSQHRLPDKIIKQTPQTESLLMNFFGAAEGSKSHFWMQCIDIWSATLAPYPAYAGEVKKYFDMLLRSSLIGNRLDPAVAPIKPSIESNQKPLKPHVTASVPASPAPVIPASPVEAAAPVVPEPLVDSVKPVAPEPIKKPDQPDVAVPSSRKTGPLNPAQVSEPVASTRATGPLNPAQVSEPVASTRATGPLNPAQVSEPVASTRATGPLNPAQVSEPDSSTRATGPLNPDKAPISAASEPESKTLPRNAYLVLQGTRVIPLNRSFIKIGRQLDNHIILEDPRVSRSHAQIKLINDRFVIFDMNSTGGTFVNGQPTSQSVLYPGDVVSLAGVVFIFSQEMPAKPGDMKIIELGSPFAADRPTVILRREEIKAAKKIGPKGLPDLPKTGPLK